VSSVNRTQAPNKPEAELEIRSPSSAVPLRWSSSGSATSATAPGSSGMSRSAQPSRSSPR